MKTGWVKTTENIWMFCNASGGALTGWQYINSKWYYFASEKTPAVGSTLSPGPYMVTGRQSIAGATYSLASSGAMQTGWVKEDGVWSFYATSGRITTNSWVSSGGTWYYVDAAGKMVVDVTGLRIGNAYYSFADSGAMKKGWVKTADNIWLYHGPSGAAQTGWQYINNKWYYFASVKSPAQDSTLSPGIYMASGRQNIAGATYRLASASDGGAMRTGWVSDGGTWYYYASSGRMLKSAWLASGSSWYYLGSDGAMVTGNHVLAPYGTKQYSDFASNGKWLGYSAHQGA